MTVNVDAAELAAAAKWVGRVVPANPPVPVLAGVKVDASEGRLRLAGFDFEAQARAEVHADGGLDVVLVGGRLLSDAAQVLRGQVTLTLDGGRLLLQAGSQKHRLPVMPLDDYPQLPVFPDPQGDVAGLVDAVGRVCTAASSDMSLPILTTVRVRCDGAGSLTLTTTDRYQLAMETLTWDGPKGEWLVPAKQFLAVTRDAGDKVGFGVEPNRVSVTAPGRSVSLLTAEGAFPKIEALVPASTPPEHVADVDRAELVQAVKVCALYAEKGKPVRLSFEPGAVTVSASTDTNADGTMPVAAAYEGAERVVAFDPRYLLNAVEAVAGPVARLRLGAGNKPCLVEGLQEVGGDPDTTRTRLLMPIRIPS